MTYLQPPDADPNLEELPWAGGAVRLLNPFSPAQMAALAPLSTEEVSGIISGYDPATRLNIVRDLQDLRHQTQDERVFEEEVEKNRARKRAKIEADRRDTVERELYLSSDEGLAEAAAAFEAEGGSLDDLEDPEELIEGFLFLDTLVRTFGAPKTLKSFVTLDMAACVSLGKEWHGRRVRQARVLYVVAEGARGFRKRRDAWNEFHQTEMKVHFYPKPVQIADNDAMHGLIAFCRIKQIEYVIFDTQARCTVGVEENDNTEMGEIVHALGVLREKTGACVHMVHHAVGSDPTKARGATAWDGAVDAEFYTKRDKKTDSVELVTKFQKDVSEAETLRFMAVSAGASLVLDLTGGTGESGGGTGEVAPALVSEPNAIYLKALAEFPDGCTKVALVREMKELGNPRSENAVAKALGKLHAADAVEKTGTTYRVSQSGLVFLDQWRRKSPPEDAQTMIE